MRRRDILQAIAPLLAVFPRPDIRKQHLSWTKGQRYMETNQTSSSRPAGIRGLHRLRSGHSRPSGSRITWPSSPRAITFPPS